MKINKFDLAWIVVNDINKAIQFYTEVVGMKLLEFNEKYKWAELCGHSDGARLGIAQKNSKDNILPGQNAVITLTVDNIVKAKEELIQKGAKFIGDVMEVPGIVKLQMVLDEDGNHFQLAEMLLP